MRAIHQQISEGEARAIAREAYVYGFPLVDSYRIQYSYFVDRDNSEYKGGWNQIHNTARLYTPEDKAVQTPNADTPYSFVGADLRAEPLVLTIPAMEKDRYFSAQFIDAYTFNFAYVGSRTTGNDGGSFLLAGPRWNGDKPPGVESVIRSETELAFVLYRTQLFTPDDIDNVVRIQADYKVEPLSRFLGKPAPPPAPQITFLKPLTVAEQRTSPEFFNVLNFVLRFCPTHSSEKDLLDRFARIGIGADESLEVRTLPAEILRALQDGIADAWRMFSEFKENEFDTGRISSGNCFGTREFLKNNYVYRMAGAALGIYGNSKEEAIYPLYFVDSSGRKMDGSNNRYTLRFPPQQLPQVNAFWSLTLYELPSSLLSKNPLNRYLINSAMLPSLRSDAGGGLTINIQHESPGAGKESNWLPAPSGPFFCALRLYWPKPEALEGAWTAPPMERQSRDSSSSR
jgi:hypothetical protein